jgi:hypothetical protein
MVKEGRHRVNEKARTRKEEARKCELWENHTVIQGAEIAGTSARWRRAAGATPEPSTNHDYSMLSENMRDNG